MMCCWQARFPPSFVPGAAPLVLVSRLGSGIAGRGARSFKISYLGRLSMRRFVPTAGYRCGSPHRSWIKLTPSGI